jgi:hypothetical protein
MSSKCVFLEDAKSYWQWECEVVEQRAGTNFQSIARGLLFAYRELSPFWHTTTYVAIY